MAKEKKAPKKATAQVKNQEEVTLNENEFDSPAYDYGLEGFYGYPGYSDYPYPTTSEYPVTGDDFYSYDYGTYDYTIETVPGIRTRKPAYSHSSVSRSSVSRSSVRSHSSDFRFFGD